jgi:hypothetical protein
MQAAPKQLKPLSGMTLTGDEKIMLAWLRGAKWEAQETAYKAKVPEFFNGVRLYKMQGGATTGAGAMGLLDVFIKKLDFQGVIAKQEMYPVTLQGNARFVTLREADLANLGIGGDDDDGL